MAHMQPSSFGTIGGLAIFSFGTLVYTSSLCFYSINSRKSSTMGIILIGFYRIAYTIASPFTFIINRFRVSLACASSLQSS